MQIKGILKLWTIQNSQRLFRIHSTCNAAPAMRLTGSRSHAAEVMRVVVTKTDVIGITKTPGHRMHRCCLKSYCVDHQSKRRQVGGRL